tara:strand:- start:4452 stop:4793 length:342 start_codon:yes stop_codon:yes gene_type:complete
MKEGVEVNKMWIAFNDSWLSIVENRNDEDTLLVRARSKDHILNVFPNCDWFKDETADYPYRVYITREHVADVVSKRLMEISYPNFKNSVDDEKLHNVYSNIWSEIYYCYHDER